MDRTAEGSFPTAFIQSKWFIPLFAALLLLPLLHFVLSAGGGLWYALLWSKQFTVELGHTVYPRWLPGSFSGHGAPVFYFYPPLFFYVAASFDAFLPTNVGLLLALWAVWSVSGLAMRVWLAPLGKGPATAASLLYLALPYHLWDLAHRADVAEFASYAVLPLVALGVRQIIEGTSRGLLSLAYAALIFTHMPEAALVGLFFIAPLATMERKYSVRILGEAALGVCIAAVYLFPALGLLKYLDHQVLWRPGFIPYDWSIWFLPSWEDKRHSMVVAVDLLMIGLATFAMRSASQRWFLLTILSAAMAAGLIPMIWKLPVLKMVQYPWRLAVVAEFGFATLLAYAWKALTWRQAGNLISAFAALSITVLLRPTAAIAPIRQLESQMPDLTEYLPEGAPVKTGPIGSAYPAPRAPRSDVVVFHRYAFPDAHLICAGRRSASEVIDGHMAIGVAGCIVERSMLPEERIGWLTSAIAAIILTLYFFVQRGRRPFSAFSATSGG